MKTTALYLVILLSVSSCKLFEVEPTEHGWVLFYTRSKAHGDIRVSISKSSFIVPMTNNPTANCGSGATGNVLLTEGEYNFTAIATDGTRWAGEVEISKDLCMQIEF